MIMTTQLQTEIAEEACEFWINYNYSRLGFPWLDCTAGYCDWENDGVAEVAEQSGRSRSGRDIVGEYIGE